MGQRWDLDGGATRSAQNGAEAYATSGAQPTAGVIDSQSVKTTEAGGVRGYYKHKNVNGRKRHIVVDTLAICWK